MRNLMIRLKSADLVAIVDFLYCGEANVYQDNLDSFLAIAEELQLKGLMGKTDEKLENTINDEKLESQMNKPSMAPKPREPLLRGKIQIKQIKTAQLLCLVTFLEI